MGNKTSQVKIGFEDMQLRIQSKCVIINTLPENMQDCLIPTTTFYKDEESIINNLLKNSYDTDIIIYGMNNNDESVIRKYKQLTGLGFQKIYIYLGGMFEWLLLQDIYGSDNFETTTRELDIMKFKPVKNII
jgi:hypothetical protein